MSIHELDSLFGPISPVEALEAETVLLSMRFIAIAEAAMVEQGLTKKALAQKISTSASYVTQLFRGDKVLNLESIVKLEHALGIKYQIGRFVETSSNV